MMPVSETLYLADNWHTVESEDKHRATEGLDDAHSEFTPFSLRPVLELIKIREDRELCLQI